MKSNLCIAFLILTLPVSIFTMDELPKPKKKKRHPLITCAKIAGEIILGNAPTQELMYLFAPSDQPTSFTHLPSNIQYSIINLFLAAPNTKSLTYAGRGINALAQINKQLNQVINQPAFSLQVIKFLSHRFNIDNETVCECMQTKETKKLLSLQRTLRNLCIDDRTTLKNFIDIRLQGTDLNFTYKNGMTLLLFCLNYDDFRTLGYLLQKGADPNLFSPGGTTPLVHSVLFNHEHIVELLIAAGADPDLMDSTDMLTPYGVAGLRGNDRMMRLIASYIDKKHKNKKSNSSSE